MTNPPGRVIRTPNIRQGDALVVPAAMYGDSKSRVFVDGSTTDDQAANIEQAILHHEKMQRAVEAINAITERLHPQPQRPRRQAMILEFPDGHREYSPDVEVIPGQDFGDFTLKPIVPFRRIPEGERSHA